MAYLLLAYFAYLLNIQGPILPFLRDQLRLTYAGVSLHLSAFAAGEIAAGLIGDWVARVFGRWQHCGRAPQVWQLGPFSCASFPTSESRCLDVH